MDIKQDSTGGDASSKIFSDLSEVPLLPGHVTYMVQSDAELDAHWEQLADNQNDMNEAYKALSGRIVAFLQAEGLLDQVSGIAATKFNCVWLHCSMRVWAHLEKGLGLTAWSNPDIFHDKESGHLR